MVKKRNYITLLLVAVFITSCFDSNKIYFEIQDQSIKSCNKKGIKNLYIQNSATPDMYYLVFNDTIKRDVPKVIYIDSISNLYSIYQGWQKKPVNNNSFRLAPLSQYKIERVQGDASAYKIEIWTDKNGKVIKTSKENCTN